MDKRKWTSGVIREFSAEMSLAQILISIEKDNPDWVILDDSIEEDGDDRGYRGGIHAFRPEELRAFARHSPSLVAAGTWASSALGLPRHRSGSSDRRETEVLRRPSQMRVIEFDRFGDPIRVGEIAWQGRVADEYYDFVQPALAANGDGGEETATVEAILSADGPERLQVGREGRVKVRIELAAGADPLDHATVADLDPGQSITVGLVVRGPGIEIRGARELTLDPPSAAQPVVEDDFRIVATTVGTTALAVVFFQNGAKLGSLLLEVKIQSRRRLARARRIAASTPALPLALQENHVLQLTIQEQLRGNEVRYLYWIDLKDQFNRKPFESAPLQHNGQPLTSSLDYVESIYTRVKDAITRTEDDLFKLRAQLEGIGASMCRHLFGDELAGFLWDHRDRLEIVEVTSFEPFIPWELLRLERPGTNEIDEKFLCEYNLIRTYWGDAKTRTLHGKDWRYLIGAYIEQPPVGPEKVYFTETLPARGVPTTAILAEARPFLEALAAPDFDVLHVACHGSADLADIAQSRLILGERVVPKDNRIQTVPDEVLAETVRTRARLGDRKPLIFLNGCETGRHAPHLTRTDWEGWPITFWKAGAGAFVGTLWSVRDTPAHAFAEAFYDALRGDTESGRPGVTLAEAATAARLAAKQHGDASWLAYVVYGNPMARMDPAS